MTRSPTPSARFIHRFLAWVYDLLLLAALLFAVSLMTIIVRGSAIPPGTWWYDMLLAGVVVLFYVGFWVKGGQTLGMKAWHLWVVDDTNRRLSVGHAVRRCLAGIPCWLPAGLGFFWMLVDRRQLTWQDRLSHSRVVRVTEPATTPQP